MNIMRRICSLLVLSSLLFCGVSLSAAFAQVTPPEKHLGVKVGSDFFLASYEQAVAYFEKLATESPRIKIADMGPTSEGRRMKYAIISSEENMAKLDRYKETVRKLSLGRGVSKEEAVKLADEGKAVVWIDGGMHATEVGPAQMQIQLAYDMVAGEDRRTRLIRDNVILLLVYPNPDGMTMVSKWYMSNVGTPFETANLPVQYQKYAGHDNNRDSFMSNLVETQNVNRTISKEWFPEILWNQHMTAPFPARIFISPFAEALNPNEHPITVRWRTLIGANMMKGLDDAGMDGAISRTNFEIYWPGYYASVVSGQNIPSIVTETALHRLGTPQYYTVADFPEAFRDLTAGVFYPRPWKGGWWHLADAVAYNLTAGKALLETAAKYRYDFLFDKWKMATDTIERFKKEPPYGWIIPADQRDPNTTALMLNRLMLMGLEAYIADKPFVYEGISYTKGSYIIPTSQPFGLHAKNLLEIQDYPDLRKYPSLWQGIPRPVPYNGPTLRPYDSTGWTMPVAMGVDSHMMTMPLDVAKTPITEAVAPVGEVSGTGPQFVFTHADNNGFMALNRILKAGGKVACAVDDFTVGGTKYPKGAFIVEGASIPAATLQDIASKTRIPMQGGAVSAKSRPVQSSRIGLYRALVVKPISQDRRVMSADTGWMTYLFEMYNVPYYLLTDSEVKAGSLRERFDVIVLPDEAVGSTPGGGRGGRGAESPPPGYGGGLGSDGIENLKSFVEEGGTLVCNKASSSFAINTFKLPVKNVLSGVSADVFSCLGSLLKVNYNTSHPLAYGMKEKGICFFGNGMAWEVAAPGKGQEDSPVRIVAGYPDEPLLVSGWLLGGAMLQGKAAVLDGTAGKGKIVLFGFNVLNRAQLYSTAKLLLNSVYYR